MPQVSRTRIPFAFLLGFSVLIGCRDSSRTGPPETASTPVTVSYVCGNDFDIHNESGTAVTVGYAVLATSERGELLLPAASSGGSTIRLTTLHRGTLQVSSGDDRAAPVENGGQPCAAPEWRHRTEAMEGQWTSPFPWPVVAVHLHLLPSGLVLSWGRIGEPQLWDPASGTFTSVPSSTMVFCSGHTFLADGRLLVAGGHLADLRGLRDVNVFDGSVSSWEPKPKMRWARWYPTSTALADGEVLTIGGTDEAGAQVATPEVWGGESWRRLGGAARVLPYYPRTFVAPNGMVFYAGELPESGYLDPSGVGSWTPVAASHYGRRDYGSAVMYSPGKVLIVGGSDPPDGAPTNTAEVIDLNEATPSWRYTGPMAYPRRQLNATVLPDGAVLVTGGTRAAGFSDPAGSVHAADAWDPGTGRWSLLASSQVDRVYHSTTILLADGRVLHAGSGDGPGLPRQLTAELFSPPYLFRGDRPAITQSPETIGYGQAFVVATPDGAQVVRVTLVRLGSVTHAFDQSQRFIELTFERTAEGLRVTAPASGALAPPGPYLLTVLNDAGVPSVAQVVRVG